MGMLTNGPACSFFGHDEKKLACSGKLHQYNVRMVAKLDGIRVHDAPEEKTYVCEGHYPDIEDPKFLKCTCDLCKIRAARN